MVMQAAQPQQNKNVARCCADVQPRQQTMGVLRPLILRPLRPLRPLKWVSSRQQTMGVLRPFKWVSSDRPSSDRPTAAVMGVLSRQLKSYLWLCVFIVQSAHVHSADALSADVRLRSLVEHQVQAPSAYFSKAADDSFMQALDVELQQQGWQVAATAWHQQQVGHGYSEGTISELYYGDNLGDWSWTVGKRKIDWDVSYGFRPLDLFSPTDPLANFTAVAPGVLQLATEYLTADGAWTLLCNQSRPDYRIAAQQVAASWGCGARYYQRVGDWELQGLVHHDGQLQHRLGFTAAVVATEALELHTSLLWQQRYITSDVHPTAFTAAHFELPVQARWQRSAWQAVVGLNYTTQAQLNWILEYWYDGRTPTDTSWQQLSQLVNALSSTNPLTPFLRQASQQQFAAQNLQREQWMLHVRRPFTAFTPELTIVGNPHLSTWFINTKVRVELTEQLSAAVGVREYAGNADGAYRQLAQQRSWFATLEWRF